MLLARRLIEAGRAAGPRQLAARAGRLAPSTTRCGTRTPRTPTGCRTASARSSTSRFAALIDDLDRPRAAGRDAGRRHRRVRPDAADQQQGGRDHWGHVFSFALAGAGIRGGQVIGASDKNGAYPATDPIRGGDLTATIFHLLGIDPDGMFLDKTNRPAPDHEGRADRRRCWATRPATTERCQPGGDPAFVPPYDASLLLDTDFRPDLPLVPPAPPSRDKGWRASPSGPRSRPASPSARRPPGWSWATASATRRRVGDRSGGAAVLAQEIRNARGGHYTFTVKVTGVGSSRRRVRQGLPGQHDLPPRPVPVPRHEQGPPRRRGAGVGGVPARRSGRPRRSRWTASSAPRCRAPTSRSATAWASRSSSRRSQAVA